MSVPQRSLLVVVLACAAVVAPIVRAPTPAVVSPREAAARAERDVPPLGVVWGKLRGWERQGDGWALVWQPAHGAWTVTAWVGDGAAPVRSELAAAPWLPGARLSAGAARLLAGVTVEGGTPVELGGRRDWRFPAARVVGALPAGVGAQARRLAYGDPWAAVVLGLVLAGALARTVLPTLPSRAWRRLAMGGAGLVLLALPAMVPLAAGMFRAGVRPWVTGLAFVAAGAVVLGGVAVAAIRFPALAGTAPPWWASGSALALGAWLALLAPMPRAAELLGCQGGLATGAALAVLLAFVVSMAGDGLRALLSWARGASGLLLLALAATAVALASPAAVLLVGASCVAGRGRSEGGWISLAAMWGWVMASLQAAGVWPGAAWSSLAAALAPWTLLAWVVVGGLRGRGR